MSSLLDKLDDYVLTQIVAQLNAIDRYTLRATCARLRAIIDTMMPLSATLIDAIELRIVSHKELARRDRYYALDARRNWMSIFRPIIDSNVAPLFPLTDIDRRPYDTSALFRALNKLRPFLTITADQESQYDPRHILRMLRQLEAANMLREGAKEILCLEIEINNSARYNGSCISLVAHIIWRYLAKRGIKLKEDDGRRWRYYGDGRVAKAYRLRYERATLETQREVQLIDIGHASFIRRIMKHRHDPMARHESAYIDAYRDARNLVELYHISRAHPVMACVIENIFADEADRGIQANDPMSYCGCFLPQCLMQFGYARFANRLYDMCPILRKLGLYQDHDQLRCFILYAITSAKREGTDIRDVLRELSRVVYYDNQFPLSRERSCELLVITLTNLYFDISKNTCTCQSDRAWNKIMPARQMLGALLEGITDTEISNYESAMDERWELMSKQKRSIARNILRMISSLRTKK